MSEILMSKDARESKSKSKWLKGGFLLQKCVIEKKKFQLHFILKKREAL